MNSVKVREPEDPEDAEDRAPAFATPKKNMPKSWEKYEGHAKIKRSNLKLCCGANCSPGL